MFCKVYLSLVLNNTLGQVLSKINIMIRWSETLSHPLNCIPTIPLHLPFEQAQPKNLDGWSLMRAKTKLAIQSWKPTFLFLRPVFKEKLLTNLLKNHIFSMVCTKKSTCFAAFAFAFAIVVKCVESFSQRYCHLQKHSLEYFLIWPFWAIMPALHGAKTPN